MTGMGIILQCGARSGLLPSRPAIEGFFIVAVFRQ